MFTGLVEIIGAIDRVTESELGRELRVRCHWVDLRLGESIALNGACLTVRTADAGWFTVSAVSTTLDRTTIGSWAVGTAVNLERAMRLGERLGGHLVQGHVDGVGTVLDVRRRESALLIDIAVPSEVARFLVPHGSITVDGVSLTVNELPAQGALQVSLIEWTEHHTTLGLLQPGDRVHLEADVIGK
ncbi:MAG TPA: riboflavin synthase, partial [Gemmatimonadaceae bacterium]|nr:riboflavin synthase [Gemmatimonadaceae bacterium]